MKDSKFKPVSTAANPCGLGPAHKPGDLALSSTLELGGGTAAPLGRIRIEA